MTKRPLVTTSVVLVAYVVVVLAASAAGLELSSKSPKIAAPPRWMRTQRGADAAADSAGADDAVFTSGTQLLDTDGQPVRVVCVSGPYIARLRPGAAAALGSRRNRACSAPPGTHMLRLGRPGNAPAAWAAAEKTPARRADGLQPCRAHIF